MTTAFSCREMKLTLKNRLMKKICFLCQHNMSGFTWVAQPGSQVWLLNLRAQFVSIRLTRSDFNSNVSFVSKRKVLACNANILGAKSPSILNVLDELTTAWRLKRSLKLEPKPRWWWAGNKILRLNKPTVSTIRYSRFFAKSTVHSR